MISGLDHIVVLVGDIKAGATAYQTLLTSVYDTDPMYVNYSISEQRLLELQKVLRRAEDKTREKVGLDVGVWVEKFEPQIPQTAGYTVSTGDETDSSKSEADLKFDKVYGIGASQQNRQTAPTVSGSKLDTINLVCRVINLEGSSSEANTELAYELKSQFEASPKFGEGVVMGATKREQGNGVTLALSYQIKLKRPLKF